MRAGDRTGGHWELPDTPLLPAPTQPPCTDPSSAGLSRFSFFLGEFHPKRGVGTVHYTTPDSLLWVAKLWGPCGWPGGVTVAPSDHSAE